MGTEATEQPGESKDEGGDDNASLLQKIMNDVAILKGKDRLR